MSSFCMSRRHLLGGAAAGAALALCGCQVAPGTGQSGFNLLSPEAETSMGRETHPEILKEFGGAYDDPALQAYVAGLGAHLVRMTETPEANFRFTVLNSPIVNAMALPGGYIYVTRGLLALADSEAELAGVIGHEIGHVTARHSAQRYSRSMAADVLTGVLGAVVGIPGVGEIAATGASAYLQGYSRDQENEADTLGLRYMARGGYDPGAMAGFLAKLREQARLEALLAGRDPNSVDQYNFMASHPRTLDRVQAAAQSVGSAAGGRIGRDEYLARIDTLVYGDDPSQGVVRDRVFMHPGLGLRFEVPQGFRLSNGQAAVTAQHSSGALIRFDTARWSGTGGPAAYMQTQWAGTLRLSDVEQIDVNGLPAATGRTQAKTSQGAAVDLRLVAIAAPGGVMWRFLFVTPPAETAALSEGLRRTTYSVRQLSAEERGTIKPYRIQIITAATGDSVETLAARLPFTDYRVERFRVLNGLGAGEGLAAGRRLKTVI